MADIVPRGVRSRMMSSIQGKDTKPEMVVRKGLHARGFRYKLHDPKLPGKPDLVFPKYRAVILVNGCFWHMHGCELFKLPSTRPEFWKKKLEGNRARDQRNIDRCLEAGWRVLVVWECAVKGRHCLPIESVLDRCEAWLAGDEAFLSLPGADVVQPANNPE